MGDKGTHQGWVHQFARLLKAKVDSLWPIREHSVPSLTLLCLFVRPLLSKIWGEGEWEEKKYSLASNQSGEGRLATSQTKLYASVDSRGSPAVASVYPRFGLSVSPWLLAREYKNTFHGRVPEWSNGFDCKSNAFGLRWFKSTPSHYKPKNSRYSQTTLVLEWKTTITPRGGVVHRMDNLIICSHWPLGWVGGSPWARLMIRNGETREEREIGSWWGLKNFEMFKLRKWFMCSMCYL